MSRAFEPPAGRRVFTRDFTPLDTDIDANGHVNNVVYLAWAQTLAIAHWDSAATAEESAAWAWIALRHEVDYLRALMPDSTAVARTWVGEPLGPRFARYVRIEDGEGRLCAQGVSEWCLIEPRTMRPTRIPADMLQTFERR